MEFWGIFIFLDLFVFFIANMYFFKKNFFKVDETFLSVARDMFEKVLKWT